MDGPAGDPSRGDPSHENLRALFGDYAGGRVDDWQRAVVDQHVYWCLDCRSALRATLQPDDMQDRPADADERRVAPARRRRRWFRR